MSRALLYLGEPAGRRPPLQGGGAPGDSGVSLNPSAPTRAFCSGRRVLQRALPDARSRHGGLSAAPKPSHECGVRPGRAARLPAGRPVGGVTPASSESPCFGSFSTGVCAAFLPSKWFSPSLLWPSRTGLGLRSGPRTCQTRAHFRASTQGVLLSLPRNLSPISEHGLLPANQFSAEVLPSWGDLS